MSGTTSKRMHAPAAARTPCAVPDQLACAAWRLLAPGLCLCPMRFSLRARVKGRGWEGSGWWGLMPTVRVGQQRHHAASRCTGACECDALIKLAALPALLCGPARRLGSEAAPASCMRWSYASASVSSHAGAGGVKAGRCGIVPLSLHATSRCLGDNTSATRRASVPLARPPP